MKILPRKTKHMKQRPKTYKSTTFHDLFKYRRPLNVLDQEIDEIPKSEKMPPGYYIVVRNKHARNTACTASQLQV